MQPLLELPDQTSLNEIDEELLDIFVAEVEDIRSEIVTSLNSWKANPDDRKVLKILQRNFHTLKGSGSLVAGAETIAKLGGPFEQLLSQVMDAAIPAHDATAAIWHLLDQVISLLPSLVERFKTRQPATDEVTALIAQARQLTEQLIDRKRHGTPEESDAEDETETVIRPLPKMVVPQPVPPEESVESEESDEPMAYFIDEAEGLLEHMQSLLGGWQANPNDQASTRKLKHDLHTLKGASRAVGLGPMGDLCHGLESVFTLIEKGGTQSNPKLHQIVQKMVQNGVDELTDMLEKACAGESLDEKEVDDNEVPDNSTSAKEREDGIRVGAAVIDKLTELVGELSLSRAHLEQQQEVVKNNLSEMELTVARLRDQLRRSEVEDGAQMRSQVKGVTELKSNRTAFVSPELDHFSVRQQLSRSLLESISDLLHIQEAMTLLNRQTDNLLIQQARMGAELQYAVTRTRMRPFSSISSGLQRTVRKTAEDKHKAVDLIIKGEEIEFERTVLTPLNEALGHLLRNAIGHGIEDATTRQQAGKSAKGKITIDISKEGTELILNVRDDGAGLNLRKIRKKAEEQGLIKPAVVIGDHELVQVILRPGFSTASQVTTTEGRGVGMDVVNETIQKLGGNLHIHSTEGKGTRFEIRLPLSLTITQALLVQVGEETLAVPIDNVEAVIRIPYTEVLRENRENRRYKYLDHDYRVYRLGDLLGISQLPTDKHSMPSLLIHAADRRVALLVDHIEGSKEIVVKSVGPQMETIRWLAGATILGDGRVVLILDVPALMRLEESPYIPTKPPKLVKAVKTIMVIDDSITVRKVTTRLLKRQGMAVLTAKDGVDALTQLQEQLPDLMLLDVEMPKMDGYELATQIRNTPNWKHIPIIMITSRSGTKHRDRAAKIGIDRYLGKPFNEMELLENINALLNEDPCRLK